MTLKGTKGRPVRVAWNNELPNQIIPGFDATVDCAEALYCYPYNRLVTHVHGAHTGPESDGWTRGWFTPGFNITGTVGQPSTAVFPGPFNGGTPMSQTYQGWISTSAAVATNAYQYGPEGTYYYPMDQEASTIWYHDHAMGVTHLNTNMGLAGFFPITDDNEKCMQGISTPLCTGAAPSPAAAKILPTSPFEYGYALQDRIFDTNGQFAMPDSKVIHPLDVGTCSPVKPTVLGCSHTPLFMYSTPTVAANPLNSDPGHLIPYVAAPQSWPTG
ncbi:MAG: multicopper oxidase domain-containing protein [Desulfuromonadales bacterium]|nr:multicopper oxidase domain-containing protein [Desulfuromonadales bacterium]